MWSHCPAMQQAIQRLLSSPLPSPSPSAPIDTPCGVACCSCTTFTPPPFAEDRCLCTHLWAHHMGPPTDVTTHPPSGEDGMSNLSSTTAEMQNGEGASLLSNPPSNASRMDVHVAFPPSLLSETRVLLEDMGPRAILLCLGRPLNISPKYLITY